ncbi:MAG: hypothetical protein P8L91_06870 [Candidatus Marinimicrobia bacterium]|nr:hypothetical protein [Candidatus Neomarinimicrobiota bacterium]
MKKIVIWFLPCVIIYSQSADATMTIYKNGLALIKQPVSWIIDNQSNEIEYEIIPEGINKSTPYLNLSNGKVLNQKLNYNIFSENTLFKKSLGSSVTITTIDDEDQFGTLISISPEGYTVQTRRDVIYIKKNQVKQVAVRKIIDNPRTRPVLQWDIISETNNQSGNLIYMTNGFEWNAVYRMELLGDGSATLIPEAYISNYSSITFDNLKIKLVEGVLGNNQKNSIRSNRKLSSVSRNSEMGTQIGEESVLGDYHIYNYPKRFSFGSNEHVSVRLYESRKINYSKIYVFQNGERRQKEEPLEIEFQVENTIENNLNIPLPQGRIALYEYSDSALEFTGEDNVKQTPKGEVLTIRAGRSFDVIGKRRVVNFDRQRKSEEASIEILINNTKDEEINIRLEEKILGDWVIKDASNNYIKKDATTIHFPLSISKGKKALVTYTYRREWN